MGVDILPLKTCNLNCVYCELGSCSKTTSVRKEYTPTDQVKNEIQKVIEADISFDAITFSASGETTLHSNIEDMLHFAKKLTSKPVVVITNGTTFTDDNVRKELKHADIVIPSLDAVTERTFRKINRPGENLHIEEIIHGLYLFSREFHGEMWLEIFLVKGINDSNSEIEGLIRAAKEIDPDRVQLNTVHRPPAEQWIRPLERSEMDAISARFGSKAEVIAKFKEKRGNQDVKLLLEAELIETLKRRPLNFEDLESMLGVRSDKLKKSLEDMFYKGIIDKVRTEGKDFFKIRQTYQG